MTNLKLTLAALAFAFAAGSVQAAPAAAPEATTLEAVVVTPTARYTASEWQARIAQRNAVVLERVVVTARRSEVAAPLALAAVTLDPVIVTPSARYTVAEWNQRQARLAYVKGERRGVQAWLKAVWKHFRFARTQVEV